MRPQIAAPVIRDAAGQVIDYGNRWDGDPPEAAYSVLTHPERFAPLHTVADALLSHLQQTYDVAVVEGPETAADLLHPVADVVRAVRVTPADPACASLTVVCTADPAVIVHAGLLHDFPYPDCSCDACDLSWVPVADDLERDVLAVVAGHYRERLARGTRLGVEYAFTTADVDSSGRGLVRGIPADRVRSARPVLRRVTDGWRAWPRSGPRAQGGSSSTS